MENGHENGLRDVDANVRNENKKLWLNELIFIKKLWLNGLFLPCQIYLNAHKVVCFIYFVLYDPCLLRVSPTLSVCHTPLL